MTTRLRICLADVLWLAAAVGLGIGALGVNRTLESVRSTVDPPLLGPLPDGKAIRVASVGFDRVIADLFWVRTVFHVGDERTMHAGYPGLDRLANLVTDIDPQFDTVYVVMSGAIIALQGSPDAGIALLEKGTRHSDYWKIYFLLGMNYFLERLDLAAAARHLQLASERGGPPYLPLLASRLYLHGGERETALTFIRARLKEEQDPSTREALQKRYWNLWITRDLEGIDAAIAAFRAREARAPRDIEELVGSGDLKAEPRDPHGGRYRIEVGRATTDLSYDELELHVPYRPTRPSAEIQERYERLRESKDREGTR